MSQALRSIPVFLLLALGTIATAAQDKPVLATNPPPMAPKETVLKTEGSAGVYYQEYKDISVARNRAIQLFRNETGWGQISASFTSSGKALSKPSTINIGIFIAAKDRVYVDDRRLELSADGKNVFNGSSQVSDGRTNGREIYSSLKVEFAFKDFKKLAKAKKITLKVGPTQFELMKEMTVGFRDLVALAEEKRN